jgi:hypothetical protein
MPLEPSVFPEEVQLAFFIFGQLKDTWEGNSGTYMGKIWSDFNFLVELYEIQDVKEVFKWAKVYENILVEQLAEEAKRKRKAEEAKAGRGGKQYTHNVRG